MGAAGIRHKDQIYQFIANRGKMIMYLKVAINVKCLSSVSDGWLTVSEFFCLNILDKKKSNGNEIYPGL